MNPIYQMMMGNMPGNNVMSLLQRFQEFRQQFRGNPQAQVQQMLQSGQISQAQYDNAVNMANQLRNLMR